MTGSNVQQSCPSHTQPLTKTFDVQQLKPPACLQEVDVCTVSVGVLGDISRALEDQLQPFCDQVMQVGAPLHQHRMSEAGLGASKIKSCSCAQRQGSCCGCATGLWCLGASTKAGFLPRVCYRPVVPCCLHQGRVPAVGVLQACDAMVPPPRQGFCHGYASGLWCRGTSTCCAADWSACWLLCLIVTPLEDMFLSC